MRFDQVRCYTSIKNSSHDQEKMLEMLFTVYYPVCRKIILKTSNLDEADSEDIFSESVYILFLAIKKNEFAIIHEASMKAFLSKTCQNKAYSLFRKKSKLIHPENIELAADAEPENVISEAKQNQLIQEFFSILSKKNRQLVYLRIFEKKSYAEIGLDLNMTEMSAKNGFYRCIKTAKNHFKNIKINTDVF
jgi:RNA polymerase sigma factor (sigma-70 family)